MSCYSCSSEQNQAKVFSQVADNIVDSMIDGLLTAVDFLTNTYFDLVENKLGLQHLVLVNYLHAIKWFVIVCLLLPLVLLVLLYLSSLFLTIYKWKHQLKEMYTHDMWFAARRTLALCWDAVSRVWHGYDIEGLEKIPSDRGALIVYYHGAFPLDMYYLIAKVYLKTGRLIHPIGDRFLFYIPGFQNLLRVFHVQAGTVESCVDLLKEKKLVAISPGGVREALFSHQYKLMWNKRTGFAKVAFDSRAPIIPLFTKNSRQAFNTAHHADKIFRYLYENYKLPLSVWYGGFPVKLRTYIGDPIWPSEFSSAQQLAEKTERCVSEMIRKHQTATYILGAIIQRFQRPLT